MKDYLENGSVVKTGKEIDSVLRKIVALLKPLDLQTVILFGSCANGNWNHDSDIDLYLVTKDEFIPKNFEQKMKIKTRAAMALRDIQKEYDIDLIVHTKTMSEEFRRNGSLFSNDIFSRGLKLYG